MISTDVDRVYAELQSIQVILTEHGSPSDVVAFETFAAKTLLLAAASYFEKTVIGLINEHMTAASLSSTVPYFLNKQALTRKYHTLFDWEKDNIKAFVKLFGTDFQQVTLSYLAEEQGGLAAAAFMQVGSLRNLLVHNNYANYDIGKNSGEIYTSYTQALKLLPLLRTAFQECLSLFAARVDTNGEDDSGEMLV